MHSRPRQRRRSRMMLRPASKRPTPTATASPSSAAPVHPSFIQRLIILHDGLMPLPSSTPLPRPRMRRNPQLSEDASLEEHGEFILYYYDHSLHFPRGRQSQSASASSGRNDRNRNTPSSRRFATEEAIKFSGVCRALRSLPLALQRDTHGRKREENGSAPWSETEVVYLTDSTLVFVPLELRGDIIAIAQIPRAGTSQRAKSAPGLSQHQPAYTGFGADTSAIQAAIRHQHASFSLFFGGGIHRRLLCTKHAERSKDWVFEVDVDNEDEEEQSTSGTRSTLKTENDPLWEVTDRGQVDTVKEKLSQKKNPRRKFKRLQSLTRSSFSSVTESMDGNHEKAHLFEDSYCVDYRYGGMEELFKLRREHCKLSNKINQDAESEDPHVGTGRRERRKWRSSITAEDLFDDIATDVGHSDCERRIEKLLKILPITRLREDLENFYDRWLIQKQGLCEIMHGRIGRCVVDLVPYPLGQGSGVGPTRDSMPGQHPPTAPTAFVSLAAGEFMKSLMHEELKGARLFGISFFYRNQLVMSEVSTTSFPPEIAYMIASYFYSPKNQPMEICRALPKGDSDTSLNRWISSLSTKPVNNDTTVRNLKKSLSSDGDKHESANGVDGYMASPSSFFDSAEPKESLFVNNKYVWLPRIYLPLGLSSPNAIGPGYDDEAETYAVFFESQELNFILILELKSTGHDTDALAKMAKELRQKSGNIEKGRTKPASNETLAFTATLSFLADQLTEFCNTFSSHNVNPVASTKEFNSEKIFSNERGMDIICIDRNQSSFVLLSQHDLSSHTLKCIAPKNASAAPFNSTKQKIGWFGAKPKDRSNQEILRQPIQCTKMVDCRHKLAAYLPVDVMLAFDDMFHEIGRRSCRMNFLMSPLGEADTYDNNDTVTSQSIELCSFLPQGWVYGRVFGNVELYILLDTSKFVTINDVQKAVTRVRERIFNDKIR